MSTEHFVSVGAWFDVAGPQKFLPKEAGRGFHLSVRDEGKLLEFCHGLISVKTNLFFVFFPHS